MDSASNGFRGLNSSHQRHLLSSCQHADGLLSDIEAILTASSSKTAFPKYQRDITPAQSRTIQDYIARIRAQILRVLDSLEIHPPEPKFGSVHSVRVTLAFVRLAFDEITPKDLRGYGDYSSELIPEIGGLCTELRGLVDRLDVFLAQGPGTDLQARLDRLTVEGSDVDLVKRLAEIIDSHGLVELRPILTTILDRLSQPRFEIAVFGQVSTGKSSLLNHALGTDVLPVGVNPITAVPTRIRFGPQARLTISFADRKVEHTEIERLEEFATEQQNPGNFKGVMRLEVEYPSARLRQGIVFVDTPGLGSLAAAGAQETLAYLPQCDLGVVLVNAGSTVSMEDIRTVPALLAAGIPAQIVLSKADLLSASERESSGRYIHDKLKTEMSLDLPVNAVSIIGEAEDLLHRWFQHSIEPLLDQHKKLSAESTARKIAALRESVEAALKAGSGKQERLSAERLAELRHVEVELRRAAGRLPVVEKECFKLSDEMGNLAPVALRWAACRAAEQWSFADSLTSPDLIRRAVDEVAMQTSGEIQVTLTALASGLTDALAVAAAALAIGEPPPREDLLHTVREMPQFDSAVEIGDLRRPHLSFLGRRFTESRTEAVLREVIGDRLERDFSSYGRVLELWIRRTVGELQLRFDAHADPYRAQIDRLTLRWPRR